MLYRILRSGPACAGLLFCSSFLPGQTFEYDDAGRLVEIRFADGRGVAYEHDVAGNLTRVAPLTLPPAPSDLRISAGDSVQQDLTWMDNADSETGFRVERREAGRYTWEILQESPPDTTTFTDPLERYTRDYRYRVSALAADGLQSAYSDEAAMIRRSGSYLPEARELGAGWVEDPVFGLLYADRFPWVYSPAQGWWYFAGTDRDSLFIYDFALGWLWTRESIYPYVYSYGRRTFLYYAESTDVLRYYYDFAESRYLDVPKSEP